MAAATAGDGSLWLAGLDGSGDVTVAGDLDVGEDGDGSVSFTGTDDAYSGSLDVTGDADVGVWMEARAR